MNKKRLLEIKQRLNEIDDVKVEYREKITNATKEDIETFTKEIESLENEKRQLLNEKEQIEKTEETAQEVLNGAGKEIEKRGENTMKDIIEKRASQEYRQAFLKAINDPKELSIEERELIKTDTQGIPLPVEMEKTIWDLVYGEHCILEDITLYHTGTILEITTHTAITAGRAKKKNEGEATELESNTFATVKLVGNDFSKAVKISYATAKMTNGALEQYLIKEIAAGLGEALADNVFETIKTKTNSENKTSGTNLTYAGLMQAIGLCDKVNNLTIYCSNKVKYTKLLGMVDTNGQPIFRDGCVLGVPVKVDASCKTDLFILDSKKFVGNMVQPIMIESDRDILTHTIIHSGYCRFEGTLIYDKACAVVDCTN